MKKSAITFSALAFAILLNGQPAPPASFPFKMEELSSPRFVQALELSKGVCIIPLGIIEKHGPHLPLGTDLFEARQAATEAAKKEYAVVFPPYFAGQIFEARHQPGTIAYSSELMWKMLEETCNELARNGLKKIILVNGHGGNTSFLEYFCQSQLAERKDYVVVLFRQEDDPVTGKEIEKLKKAKLDGHAGEGETSMMYSIRPDLVDAGVISNESGLDQKRLEKMPFGYTGIWWYAQFPNHFAGDVVVPDKRLGELMFKSWSDQIVELIRYLKNNNSVEQLQDEFYSRAEHPLRKK